MVGHPDDQSYAIWRGPLPRVGFFNVTAASPVITDIITTNYASLYMFVGPLTAGVTVALGFYSDSTKVNLLILKSWVIRGGQSVSVIVPSLGNFAEMKVSTAQAGTINTQINIAPVNTPVLIDSYPDSGNIVNDPGNVAVASQVVDYFPPFVQEGEGQLMFAPTDALGKLNVAVNQINEGGTIDGIVYESLGPTVPVGPILYKTSRKPVKVTITNTDAGAAHGYAVWASLIGKG